MLHDFRFALRQLFQIPRLHRLPNDTPTAAAEGQTNGDFLPARGMLYNVGAFDPLAFTIAPAVLAAAALLATWLPARRATRG
ncbi:MAG: hypothetical protein ACR2HH_02405 [Chthoniobacterales bacterium]